ncbi:MAG: FCD domain-containing protein [Rothia sp. (in: high G+C Gram-positive bacteria)]|nr:FCD domain-containing protein [Rothia sp. (in: high G+C Gram-positive bacteria)]
MSRQKSELVVDRILVDIERGKYSIGQSMPSEAELADTYDVSRLTVREAIKYLASRGVLDVGHGRRNRIAAAETWSILDPDIAILRGKLTGNKTAWALDLIEARRIVEIGAVDLAARRITDGQLDDMRQLLERMDKEESVDDVVQADMAFHRLILDAAQNDYITATYESLEAILLSIRRHTSSSQRVRGEAQEWHRAIFAALEAKDATAARAAMGGHMQQTLVAVEETLAAQRD